MKTRAKASEPPKSGKRTMDTALLKLHSACLTNASALITEAELLLNHKHFARAFFLGYTALEELGKSQVVGDFFYDMVSEGEFRAAFSDHKLKLAYIKRYVPILSTPNGQWLIEYDRASASTDLKQRQKSLYVERTDKNEPQSPANVITHETAQKVVQGARELLNEILHMEMFTERIGTKAFTK